MPAQKRKALTAMKTSLCILALLVAFAAAPVRAADTIEKSQTVVYINGSKFYVHTCLLYTSDAADD